MKPGWQTKSLGDVAMIGAGNPAPQANELFRGGKFPFFRTSDAGKIRFGNIYDASDKLNEQGIKGLRLLPKGTIIFPKSGASTFLNHRVMLGVDGYVSSHLATIIADKSQINERFLLYFLTTISSQDLVQDHNYPSLNLPLISAIKLPCPPLHEQQYIVTILDRVFENVATARANVEKSLIHTRELFDSKLESIFTQNSSDWIESTVGKLVSDDLLVKPFDGNHGEIHPRKSDFTKSGVPFIMASDLKNGGVDAEHCNFIPRKLADSLRVGFAKDGDVLISHKGTIGRTAIVTTDHDYIMLTPQITAYRIKNQSRLYNCFVRYLFISPYFQKQFTRGAEDGSTRAYIGITKQLSLRFRFPSLDKQKKIAKELDDLSAETQRLEAIYQQKLAALVELKKSILHQAFAGQLN